ncbi:hypothetical protein EMEDMD4_370169 [Sinorhizobium medicae]|uniref:Uncharacterized protein n=1 Tax=Sinorhizobium medicae TaxID=110321 RepID=A0A508WY91_9HYPH|nr:hypothetical protein EMEDMD4_370169 [Sinorhizobium medicae]
MHDDGPAVTCRAIVLFLNLGAIVDVREGSNPFCCIDARLSGLLGRIYFGMAQGFAVGTLETPEVTADVRTKDFKHVDGLLGPGMRPVRSAGSLIFKEGPARVMVFKHA